MLEELEVLKCLPKHIISVLPFALALNVDIIYFQPSPLWIKWNQRHTHHQSCILYQQKHSPSTLVIDILDTWITTPPSPCGHLMSEYPHSNSCTHNTLTWTGPILNQSSAPHLSRSPKLSPILHHQTAPPSHSLPNAASTSLKLSTLVIFHIPGFVLLFIAAEMT